MSATAAELLVSIAEEDLGIRESAGANRGPGIEKFWGAVDYSAGYRDRAPYCAAAVCYWVAEAARRGARWLAPLPREAACVYLRKWALRHAPDKVRVLSKDPQPGDIVCFLPHFSHVGLVVGVTPSGSVETIEANTTAAASSLANEREGGGVFRRTRRLSICGSFFRLREA